MTPLTDLHVDGFVEVFVFLDQSLHAVQRVALIVAGEERLTSRHPVLGLLAVPVEELQRDSRSVTGGR